MTEKNAGPVIGILIIIVGISMLIVGDAVVPGFAERLASLDRWQDLAGAALALVAAVFGARYILDQIKQVDRIENERNRRAAVAARAVLPLSLNTISEHVRAVTTAARPLTGRTGRLQAPRGGLADLPSLSTDVIHDLQAFILAAPEEAGEQIAQIISELQVLTANSQHIWRELSHPTPGHSVMADNLHALLARAALIDARVSVLFPYARRETEETPRVGVEDVRTALNIGRLYPDAFPHVARAATLLLRRAPLTISDAATAV